MFFFAVGAVVTVSEFVERVEAWLHPPPRRDVFELTRQLVAAVDAYEASPDPRRGREWNPAYAKAKSISLRLGIPPPEPLYDKSEFPGGVRPGYPPGCGVGPVYYLGTVLQTLPVYIEAQYGKKESSLAAFGIMLGYLRISCSADISCDVAKRVIRTFHSFLKSNASAAGLPEALYENALESIQRATQINTVKDILARMSDDVDDYLQRE